MAKQEKKKAPEAGKNFPRAVVNCFTGDITPKISIALLAYFLVISLLEILAYTKGGVFSVTASRLWLFTGLALFGVFVYVFIKRLVDDVREKRWFELVGIGVVLVLFCWYTGNMGYADVNADAAQQAAAGLSSFEAADWNYTGVAFLGYANRQYILAALPALVFGRSIATLHWGFGLPFLIGMVMIYLEVRQWMKKYDMSEKLALLPVYALLGFPFITEYYMNFEQAITPVALTMMGIALFLKLYRKQDVLTFVAMSWVGCLFCDSYTPVLASLGLLLAFLGLTILEIGFKHGPEIMEKKAPEQLQKITLLAGLMINICAFFVATMLAERSDRISEFREVESLKEFALTSWAEFFTDANATFLGIFMGVVLVYLFLSFLGRLKFHDFVISVWVLGVVLFANYLVGYTSYEKSWILQRNMIIIPVLAVSIFFVLVRTLNRCKVEIKEILLASFLLFFTCCGVINFGREHQSFNYFRYIQPLKYMLEYTEDVLEENGLEATDEFNLVLHTNNLLQTNIYDYAKFLFPNATTYSAGTGEYIGGLDDSLPTFVFGENEAMYDMYPDVQSRTFENKRYKSTVIWYKSEW